MWRNLCTSLLYFVHDVVTFVISSPDEFLVNYSLTLSLPSVQMYFDFLFPANIIFANIETDNLSIDITKTNTSTD